MGSSSTSAREPKPLKRLTFRSSISVCASPRRSRCASSTAAFGRRLDEVEEHLTSVSVAAAGLMAEGSHHRHRAEERHPRRAEEPHSPGTPRVLIPGETARRDRGEPDLGKHVQDFGLPAPGEVPIRSLRPRSSSRTWLCVLLTMVLMIAGAYTAISVATSPLSLSFDWGAGEPSIPLTSSSAPVATSLAAPRSELGPRLIARETRGVAGEPLPLGLTIEGHAEGAVVVITGMIPGLSFSSGSAAGPHSWHVPATDLTDTWVGPPTGYVGEVELAAELHLDGRFVQRQPIRIEWMARTPAVPTPTPSLRPKHKFAAAPQQIQHEESAFKNNMAEQHGERAIQKHVAATVAMPRRAPAKASARRRGPIKPLYTLPTQMTRASWPGW
jgi:hypothetical protein